MDKNDCTLAVLDGFGAELIAVGLDAVVVKSSVRASLQVSRLPPNAGDAFSGLLVDYDPDDLELSIMKCTGVFDGHSVNLQKFTCVRLQIDSPDSIGEAVRECVRLLESADGIQVDLNIT